ncbi:MAG: esterase/lipase family protein [Candidatus Korobacteraceae bacterium]
MNIILAHGILGFKERFGIEYFNGVAEHLRGIPAKVFVPEVSPTGGIDQRGEELRSKIINAFNDGTLDPNEKAHIIGHSMGGLDSRYLLSPASKKTSGENVAVRIASLTSISSPHRGSLIADLLALKPAEESGVLNHLQGLVKDLSGLEEGAGKILNHFGISLHGLENLTTESMQKFNRRYPDHPAVHYFAVAGAGRPGTIATAIILLPFHEYIQSHSGQPSDGLVHLASARWGDFDAETWPCDHAEEVGHDLDHPLEAPRFDYLERYDEIVKRASA